MLDDSRDLKLRFLILCGIILHLILFKFDLSGSALLLLLFNTLCFLKFNELRVLLVLFPLFLLRTKLHFFLLF